MYESEAGGYTDEMHHNNYDSKNNLENHQSSESSLHHNQILKSNSSDI